MPRVIVGLVCDVPGLTGRVVGYGPDHEPLVVDVRPVAWIGSHALDQALRRYRERFDVGRG